MKTAILVLMLAAIGYAQPVGQASSIVLGPSLPSTCNVGQVWFQGNSTSGSMYTCTAPNTWTASGGGGTTYVKACVGSPGNTTGVYQTTLCQTSAGAIYACNNVAGCTVAADWVAVGTPGSQVSFLNQSVTASTPKVFTDNLNTLVKETVCQDHTTGVVVSLSPTNALNTVTFTPSATQTLDCYVTTGGVGATGPTGATGATGPAGANGAMPDPGGNGIMVRTALNTDTNRSLAAGTGISVTNADGTAGNPTVTLSTANRTRTCIIDNDTQSSTALTAAQFSGHCVIPAAATIIEVDVMGGTQTVNGTAAQPTLTGTSSIQIGIGTVSGGSTTNNIFGSTNALATASGKACALTSTSGTCSNGNTSSGSISIGTTALAAGSVLFVSAAAADATQTWYQVAIVYVVN